MVIVLRYDVCHEIVHDIPLAVGWYDAEGEWEEVARG